MCKMTIFRAFLSKFSRVTDQFWIFVTLSIRGSQSWDIDQAICATKNLGMCFRECVPENMHVAKHIRFAQTTQSMYFEKHIRTFFD